MKDQFIKFLIKQGYSQETPRGNPSTVYDYQKRIDKVCKWEHITLTELANNIVFFVGEYDVGGSKESYGNKSHNAVICALKKFEEFLKETRY